LIMPHRRLSDVFFPVTLGTQERPPSPLIG